ncbi:MAG TPA: protein kinase [Pyrinomonadaceae bacterium]|nr:protein kinase [Pyrinomonadaceae bacterium]
MLTPDTILQGRYRIVRQLGQGGMGAVYEAIDQRLDTTVALKETLFADERLRKQFEREARLLARLHHPALPRVSDHFSEADGQFLVMQFIPGDDLSEMMDRKRGPFPTDQVLTWADQLLDALDYLHTQDPQIIHRDIKPQNLKLTSRGQIILLDFGLAKGQAGDVSRITTSASIFGYTPNYAPLEQIQGLGTDSRSDLYSLGATLYHLMTGVKPPDALTRAAALVNGQADPLVPATAANPAVTREVDQVLAKAMAQNREQRYATALDMRKALKDSEHASTVVNRGEAQTMLFPQPAQTVGIPTQTAVRQQTIPAGETTVVRPTSRGRVVPVAISALVLFIVACGALGFYMLQSRSDEPVAQVNTTAPSPENPVVHAPTVPQASPSPEKEKDVATPSPTQQPRPQRTEEPRKEPAPKAEATVEVEVDSNDPNVRVEPEAPVPPEFQQPRIQVQRLPGGTVIRTLPDGTQLITTRDGMRVLVTKDGQKKILSPPRPGRRRPPPVPSPEP